MEKNSGEFHANLNLRRDKEGDYHSLVFPDGSDHNWGKYVFGYEASPKQTPVNPEETPPVNLAEAKAVDEKE